MTDFQRRLLVICAAAALPVTVGAARSDTGLVGSGTGDTADPCAGRPPQVCFDWVASVSGPCPAFPSASPFADQCVPAAEGPGALADGRCCYEVTWRAETDDRPIGCGCAHGRPLLVTARPLVAGARSVAGWIDPRLGRPALDGLAADARARLAHFWASVAVNEHASIASFDRAGLELLAAGAPARLVEGAKRAAVDEVRHARRAFTLASAFAGAPVGPAPLPLPASLPLDRDLPALAARTVREGCVEETTSLAAARRMLDAATDPMVRRVLAGIVRDETRHVALAWATVRWTLDAGGPETLAAVRRAFAEPLVLPRPEPAPPDPMLAAFGCVGDGELASAAGSATEVVIRPLAARLCA